MLALGYRTKVAALVLMAWSLVAAFDLHSPMAFLGVHTNDLSTVLYNLFVKNGGNLSSFYKDIAVPGALLTVAVYDGGRLFWTKDAPATVEVSVAGASPAPRQ